MTKRTRVGRGRSASPARRSRRASSTCRSTTGVVPVQWNVHPEARDLREPAGAVNAGSQNGVKPLTNACCQLRAGERLDHGPVAERQDREHLAPRDLAGCLARRDGGRDSEVLARGRRSCVYAASTPGYLSRIASATMLPIADSMQPGRVALDVDRLGADHLVAQDGGLRRWRRRRSPGRRPAGDAEVLGDAGRAAGPVDVAALDHQLEHRVASRPALMPSVTRMLPTHQVRDPVGVADDHRVDRRVLEGWSAMARIGPSHGTPGALPIGFVPDAVPWWMTTTWTLTPCLRRRSDSALIRRPRAGRSGPAVLPARDELGRALQLGADDADLDAVDVEDVRRLDPRAGACRSRSSTMLVARNGKSARACCASRRRRRRSRTRGCRTTSRRDPTRSRRRSSACPRAAPSWAARRRRCRRRRGSGPGRGSAAELLVEHRGELAARRRPATCDAVDRRSWSDRAGRGSR